MKITSITVSVKRLVALAKYENVTYNVEATADVQDNDTPTEVYENLLAFCQTKIMAEMDRMEKGMPPKGYKPTLQDEKIPDFK